MQRARIVGSIPNERGGLMRSSAKLVALVSVGLGIAWIEWRPGQVQAQDNPVAAKSARGGLLAKTAHHQFETFFYQTGVRVFVSDQPGAPVNATKLVGTVTFYHPDSPKPWFTRPLRGTEPSLDLGIGLTNAPQSGAKAVLEIGGLSEAGKSTVTFTVPVEFVATASKSNVYAPASSAKATPHYVYGPGYYGLGYYQHPDFKAAPKVRTAPTVHGSSKPGRSSSGVIHDRSTGRDYQAGGLLSKPWLRPTD
jgi:hypothetical protein